MQDRLFGKLLNDKMFTLTLFSLMSLVYGFNKVSANKFCGILGVSPRLKLSVFAQEDYKKMDTAYFTFITKLGILVDKDLVKRKRIFLVTSCKGRFLQRYTFVSRLTSKRTEDAYKCVNC